jgi:Lon protease-like protein
VSERLDDFPLFPLPMVLLPTEVVPLHIFEDRYKTMIGLCLDEGIAFGVLWLSDDGLKEVGCTAKVTEVLERMDDGRMNILVEGDAPFRLVERREQHPYPAGMVELLDDRREEVEASIGEEARETFAELVERVTDRRPEKSTLDAIGAYEMAASVEIGAEVKQGLLELRSEQARLRLLSRLFKAAMERLEVAERIAEHARHNGKVRFGGSEQATG